MQVRAEFKKIGKWWAAEVPALRVFTQGATQAKAVAMLTEAVELLCEEYGFPSKATVRDERGAWFLSLSTDAHLVSLLLRQRRQGAELSLGQAAAALGQRSKTAIARYEDGKAEPTLAKLQALLAVIAPDLRLTLG